jgi:hypothetical protein
MPHQHLKGWKSGWLDIRELGEDLGRIASCTDRKAHFGCAGHMVFVASVAPASVGVLVRNNSLLEIAVGVVDRTVKLPRHAESQSTHTRVAKKMHICTLPHTEAPTLSKIQLDSLCSRQKPDCNHSTKLAGH